MKYDCNKRMAQYCAQDQISHAISIKRFVRTGFALLTRASLIDRARYILLEPNKKKLISIKVAFNLDLIQS